MKKRIVILLMVFGILPLLSSCNRLSETETTTQTAAATAINNESTVEPVAEATITQQEAEETSTVAPVATQLPVNEEEATENVIAPKGYVRIMAGNEFRWLELPTEEPYTVTVKQTNVETGNVMVNEITLTPDGVYMATSNCDNQDCVEMGEVTLENKSTRILANYVVCLPHQISMELYSAEEIQAMIEAE